METECWILTLILSDRTVAFSPEAILIGFARELLQFALGALLDSIDSIEQENKCDRKSKTGD